MANTANLSTLILPVKDPSTGEVQNQEFQIVGDSDQPFDLAIENGVYGYEQLDGTFVPFKTQADIDRAVAAAKVGTATPGDVLSGETFTNTSTSGLTGTMTNNGAVSLSLNKTNPSRTIPEGYHNGNGTASVDLETKTITATDETQTVNPSTGKLISQVVVNPQVQDETYTYPVNSTGGTSDLGATNNYRYVNATNVYNKGKQDGGGGEVNIAVSVVTQTLVGETCVCRDSLGEVIASKVIPSGGTVIFGLEVAGTYTFSITY